MSVEQPQPSSAGSSRTESLVMGNRPDDMGPETSGEHMPALDSYPEALRDRSAPPSPSEDVTPVANLANPSMGPDIVLDGSTGTMTAQGGFRLPLSRTQKSVAAAEPRAVRPGATIGEEPTERARELRRELELAKEQLLGVEELLDASGMKQDGDVEGRMIMHVNSGPALAQSGSSSDTDGLHVAMPDPVRIIRMSNSFSSPSRLTLPTRSPKRTPSDWPRSPLSQRPDSPTPGSRSPRSPRSPRRLSLDPNTYKAVGGHQGVRDSFKDLDAAAGFRAAMGVADMSDKGLEKAFKYVDGDGSGKISKAEVKAHIKKTYGEGLDDKVVEAMITAADINRDGEVDLEEFKAIMRAGPTTRMASPAASTSDAGSVTASLSRSASLLGAGFTPLQPSTSDAQRNARIEELQRRTQFFENRPDSPASTWSRPRGHSFEKGQCRSCGALPSLQSLGHAFRDLSRRREFTPWKRGESAASLLESRSAPTMRHGVQGQVLLMS